MMQELYRGFMDGLRGKPSLSEQDRNMRDNLSQNQVDKMVKDSFPASDPPSTY